MAAASKSLAEVRLAHIKRLLALQREKQRRAAAEAKTIDVFGLLGYEPFPKQVEFHEATEFNVLYGGSLGGGKSRALVAEAIRAAVRYPGIRVGIFRRTYGELKESVIAELAQMGFAEALGATWNASNYELKFDNGSLVMFRYAQNMTDATRRQGGQYQLLIFDELTLMPPDVVAFLESRLRSGDPRIPVLGFRASANPGGPGHGAVRNRFIDPTNYGADIITDPDTGQTTRFVPSSMKDNPHLDETYRRRLNALPEELRRALRDGDWGVFAGQMFRALNRDRHVVEPITIPTTWRRYAGVDWGYTNPWAVVWGAVDEDGRIWMYRELYDREVGEAEQAKRIVEAEMVEVIHPDGTVTREPEGVVARYADDALWATRGDAKTIAAVYTEHGAHLVKAEKGGRVVGWQRVRSYLADGPACHYHRAMGWETCPMLHMFPQVENLYLELRDLVHATKGDPEDADSDSKDHASDALRYLLINLGTGPEFMIDRNPEPDPTDREPTLVAGGRYAVLPPDNSGLVDRDEYLEQHAAGLVIDTSAWRLE